MSTKTAVSENIGHLDFEPICAANSCERSADGVMVHLPCGHDWLSCQPCYERHDHARRFLHRMSRPALCGRCRIDTTALSWKPLP